MPLTSLSLLMDLTSGHFSRLDGLDEFKNRFKFAFRSLLTLPFTLRWLNTFAQDAVLLEFLRKSPSVASKLHRPYLYQSLNTAGKLAILQEHYRIECSQVLARPLATLLEYKTLELATFTGKDDVAFRVTLTHNHTFEKEGELSLQMWNDAGIPLVTLTFTFCQSPRGPALLIGGIQGPRREADSPDHIKLATKACHGLFPKRVAMEALTILARMLDIRCVQAVSKKEHIYNSWRYRKKFEADYDSFWQALEAELNPEGFFEVPLTLPRKTMEEIASKKRAEYHRRYTLLDDLSVRIASSLL